MFFQVANVRDLGAAPAVDALVVIADDAKISMLPRQRMDQLELGAVGVLVFVHHDVFIFGAAGFEGVRVFSIRAYTAGIAAIFMDVPNRVFEADLAGGVAVAFAIFIVALTTWFAVRALSRWEIGEAS